MFYWIVACAMTMTMHSGVFMVVFMLSYILVGMWHWCW